MLPALDDPARAWLLRVACAACSIALLLVPLVGRSAIELGRERGAQMPLFSTTIVKRTSYDVQSFARVRDPFIVDGVKTVRSPVIVPAAKAAVTAVITGTEARALIEENGNVRLVRVGDVISGSRVTAISRPGVRLANGAFLTLDGSAP